MAVAQVNHFFLVSSSPAMSQPPPRVRLAEALPSLEHALERSEERLRQGRFATSEAYLEQLLLELHEEAHRLYSLAMAWPDEARVRQLALCAALLRKGLSVEKLSQQARALYQELRREDRGAFEYLRALYTELCVPRLAGPGTRSPEDYQQRIEILSTQRGLLEADLATRSALLRSLREQPPPAELPSRVAAALPRDGALIEFVIFRNLPRTPQPEASSANPAGEQRYLALLLLADGSTHAADLGPAERLDAAAILIHRWLAGRSAHCHAAVQVLHELAMRPLLSRLGRVRRLFIAPDGWVALAPFAELHDGGRFLSEAFELTQLHSGRELLAGPVEGPLVRMAPKHEGR